MRQTRTFKYEEKPYRPLGERVGRFTLVKATYKDEWWEAPIQYWRGCPVKPIVRMWYHTHLKYWSVGYTYLYGCGFLYKLPFLRGRDYLNRREARKYAYKYMREARIPADIDRMAELLEQQYASEGEKYPKEWYIREQEFFYKDIAEKSKREQT